jgi:hypothetical protein
MAKATIVLHDLINRPLEVEIEAITAISENTAIFGKTAQSVIRVDGETHAVRESREQIDALKDAALK